METAKPSQNPAVTIETFDDGRSLVSIFPQVVQPPTIHDDNNSEDSDWSSQRYWGNPTPSQEYDQAIYGATIERFNQRRKSYDSLSPEAKKGMIVTALSLITVIIGATIK